MVIRHLESCVRLAIKVRDETEEYENTYPNYCPYCEGWGSYIEVDDPSFSLETEVGDTSVEIQPCDHCMSQGFCPRCGEEFDHEEESSCSSCGFIWGETAGKPYPHICICGDLLVNESEEDVSDSETARSNVVFLRNRKRRSRGV